MACSSDRLRRRKIEPACFDKKPNVRQLDNRSKNCCACPFVSPSKNCCACPFVSPSFRLSFRSFRFDRYGKGEPDSKPIDFEGSRIWSFENNQEAEIELDFDVNKGNKGKANQDDEPLLDKWAITIFEKFFIFASDVEMIKDVISGAKIAANKNAFDIEKDVAQVTEMLGNVAGSDGRSMNQVTRSDRSFEMQYELFRQGILPESRSMMATILDKILKPKNGRQPQPQKVSGAKLPPFAAIQHFFTASGGVVRTEQDGWSVQSFILSK